MLDIPDPPQGFTIDASDTPPPPPAGFTLDVASAPTPPPAGFAIDALPQPPAPPPGFTLDASTLPPPPAGFAVDAPIASSAAAPPANDEYDVVDDAPPASTPALNPLAYSVGQTPAPYPLLPGQPAMTAPAGTPPPQVAALTSDFAVAPDAVPVGGRIDQNQGIAPPAPGDTERRAAFVVWNAAAGVASSTAALGASLAQGLGQRAVGAPPDLSPDAPVSLGERLASGLFGEGFSADAVRRGREEDARLDAENRAKQSPEALATADTIAQYAKQPAQTPLRDVIREKIGPSPEQLPPPANAAEKYLVDLPLSVAQTATEIGTQRKFLPPSLNEKNPISEAAAWEIQNQAAGGTAGHGAVMGATVGMIGKALPNAPLKAAIGEGALFGGTTYLSTGRVDEALVNALLPAAMRTPHMVGWVAGKLDGAKPQERQAKVDEARAAVQQQAETLAAAGEPAQTAQPPMPASSPPDELAQPPVAQAPAAEAARQPGDASAVQPAEPVQERVDAVADAGDAAEQQAENQLAEKPVLARSQGQGEPPAPSVPDEVIPPPPAGFTLDSRGDAAGGNLVDSDAPEGNTAVDERIAATAPPPSAPGTETGRDGGGSELVDAAGEPAAASAAQAVDDGHSLQPLDSGRRESPAGRPVLPRRRAELARAVERFSPGAKASDTGNEILIRYPHGREARARFTTDDELRQIWSDMDRGRRADSLVAHAAGLRREGDDGRIFRVPRNMAEWNAMTQAEQDYISRQFQPAGMYHNGEILLHETKHTFSTLREEMFHDVYRQDLTDAQRQHLENEYGSEEAAHKAMLSLPREPAKGETVGQQLLREIREGTLHQSLPPRAEPTTAPPPEDTTGSTPSVASTPPASGLLDQVESWARGRLKTLDEGAADAMADLTPAQRRRRGSAGSLDPQRLLLHGIIGAAKIGKGIKKFADWSASMAEDLGEQFAGLPVRARSAIFRDARRLAAMDDKSRAEHVAERFTEPAGSTKATVRQLTGQVDTGRAVTEVQALAAKFKAAQRASDVGYRAGKTDAEAAAGEKIAGLKGQMAGMVPEPKALAGSMQKAERASAAGYRSGYRTGVVELGDFKKGLSDTIREALPAELHGRFLADVARIRTPGEMRLALHKAAELLAEHDLRRAFANVADLVGRRAIELPRPKAIRTPEVTETRAAEDLGARMVQRLKEKATGENLRTVDLTTLPQPARADVSKLIAKAAAYRSRMRELMDQTGHVDEKGQLVDAFNEVDREIRQRVADVVNTREMRIGDKLAHRDHIVGEVVRKVDPAGEAAEDGKISSEPLPDAGLMRLAARGHLNMETIAANMLGKDSDAYRVVIDQVRRGQEGYHAERRDFRRHLDQAFEAAEIPPGSKKLNDWLNEPETVQLPDAGEATLTRNELVGLAATHGDPETAALIDRGASWTFRSRPRDNPFKLTSRDFDAIAGMLTPGERGLIDAFKNYNRDNVTARAMAAKLELSGYAPDPHEGYFPRARNRKQQEDAGLPEGWQGYRRRVLENISSMKERAPDLTQPFYVPEFTQDTSNYIEDSARLIHLAEPVRNVAAIFEHPRVTQAVERKFGESMNKRFRDFLEETMQVRLSPPKGFIEKTTALLTRNLSRAVLQLNPSPMAKNVVGGTIALLPEFEARDLVPAVGKAFSPASYREMLDASGVAWDRYDGGGLYGQYSPLADRHVETVANMTFPEAVKAMRPGAAIDAIPFMKWADSVPLRVAWEASRRYVERTMPNASPAARRDAALAKFHDAVYATQNGNSSTETSGFGSMAKRGNPVMQGFTLFKSDNNKKLNLLLRARREGGARLGKTIAAVFLNALAGAAVAYALKEAAVGVGRAAGRNPQRDAEDEKKLRHNAGWDVLNNLAGISYFGDALMDVIRRTMTGEFHLHTPVGQTAEDAIRGIQNLAVGVYKWSQTDPDSRERKSAGLRLLKSTERAVEAGADVTGLPIAALMRLAHRGVDAATFKPEDPRLVQRRESQKGMAAETKDMRHAVPGLDLALAEHAELQRKGGAHGRLLTPAERTRKAELDVVAKRFENFNRSLKAAEGRGDKTAADQIRATMKQVIGELPALKKAG